MVLFCGGKTDQDYAMGVRSQLEKAVEELLNSIAMKGLEEDQDVWKNKIKVNPR